MLAAGYSFTHVDTRERHLNVLAWDGIVNPRIFLLKCLRVQMVSQVQVPAAEYLLRKLIRTPVRHKH